MWNKAGRQRQQVHLYKLEAEECVADEEPNDEVAPSDAAEEGGEDVLNSQEPSQSEMSDDDDETDPAVHLYNRRMRRQPVFPIQKLLHRVSILHETSRIEFFAKPSRCAGLRLYSDFPLQKLLQRLHTRHGPQKLHECPD